MRPFGQYQRMTPTVLIQKLDVAQEPDFSEVALTKAT